MPRFDPCIRQSAKVNKYQFARFDNVNYSVPRHAAFQTVTVKGYVDRVEIVLNETVIAVHERSYHAGDDVLDPLHYLTTLTRRPAALDHANVYRDWKLPAVFGELRERLERRHGPHAGVRQFVRVLQLLAEHPLSRVQAAIEQLRGPEGADADRIIRRVEASALRLSETSSEGISTPIECEHPGVLSVQVPCPSLSHFDQFLSSFQGDSDYVPEPETRCQPDAPQGQPQATPAADNPGRVREVGPRSECLEPDLRAVPAPVDRTGGRGPADQCLEQPDSAMRTFRWRRDWRITTSKRCPASTNKRFWSWPAGSGLPSISMCVFSANRGRERSDHHKTPLVTQLSRGEITVIDPAHPLYGRTFDLFGLARLPGYRQYYQVEIFPDEMTYIDVSSTNLSTAPPQKTSCLTPDALQDLVTTFRDILSRREADVTHCHGPGVEPSDSSRAAADHPANRRHSNGGTGA